MRALPPRPEPHEPAANLRYTLRVFAHPYAPADASLLDRVVWSYRNFPPPQGHAAFLRELDELLGSDTAPDGTPYQPNTLRFADQLRDELFTQYTGVVLPEELSARDVLEAYRDVALLHLEAAS